MADNEGKKVIEPKLSKYEDFTENGGESYELFVKKKRLKGTYKEELEAYTKEWNTANTDKQIEVKEEGGVTYTKGATEDIDKEFKVWREEKQGEEIDLAIKEYGEHGFDKLLADRADKDEKFKAYLGNTTGIKTAAKYDALISGYKPERQAEVDKKIMNLEEYNGDAGGDGNELKEVPQWLKDYWEAYKKGVDKDALMKPEAGNNGGSFSMKHGKKEYVVEHKSQDNAAYSKDTPQKILEVSFAEAKRQGYGTVNIAEGVCDELKAKMVMAAWKEGLEVEGVDLNKLEGMSKETKKAFEKAKKEQEKKKPAKESEAQQPETVPAKEKNKKRENEGIDENSPQKTFDDWGKGIGKSHKELGHGVNFINMVEGGGYSNTYKAKLMIGIMRSGVKIDKGFTFDELKKGLSDEVKTDLKMEFIKNRIRNPRVKNSDKNKPNNEGVENADTEKNVEGNKDNSTATPLTPAQQKAITDAQQKT